MISGTAVQINGSMVGCISPITRVVAPSNYHILTDFAEEMKVSSIFVMLADTQENQ